MAADDKYISLGGLTHYDEKIKEYAKDHCAVLEDANWQKTEAAGAVSFLPAPEMQLDPVVNFKFMETGPASGTKGPDNPSTITGVTQAKVTRCGKNLLPFPYATGAGTSNGITWTINSDGTVVANGTATADSGFSIIQAVNNKLVKDGVTYTISGCPSGGSITTYCLRFGTSPNATEAGGGKTFTGDSDTVGKSIWLKISSGTTVSNLVFKPQLELNSTATSFEPYAGTDYTISLGNTYYGGSVDLSTGIMTVTHVGNVFTGNEDVTQFVLTDNLKRYRILVSYASATWLSCTCSHYPTFYNGGPTDGTCYMVISSPFSVYFIDDSISSADDFKSFLATQYANGTPVTLVYKLATPFTVQLTPTQIKSLPAISKYEPRINTVYSDQESVQVGYPKSPIATDNELTNAIISLGGNV